MTGATFLGIDVDPQRIKKRLKTGYCDFMVSTLDEALRILKNAVRKKENVSVGLVGNCADIIPQLAERGVVPDILTDQTSAHDPLNGYVPNGMTLAEAIELRGRDPQAYQERSLDAIARHVEAMLQLQKMGAVTFDYGNNIRTFAFQRTALCGAGLIWPASASSSRDCRLASAGWDTVNAPSSASR